MPSHSELVKQMRDTLAMTEPELDTSTGSVARRMLDAVAEVVAEAYIDQQLLGYTYDIDAKMEGDLDEFVELFGISRLMGKRAHGVVVFARQESEDERFIVIPTGTQIIARVDQESRPVFFQTLAAGMLSVGDTSVSVPVQAVAAGPMSNMPAGSLNILSSPITGISALSNPEPLTGGTSMESDAELRDRWKATVFRNMAGTRQMFTAVALNQENCYAARVIGSSKTRLESVQVQDGQAVSMVEDARYIYPGNVVVGRNIRNGDIYTRDLDYSWNYAEMPPRIEVISSDTIPDGSIVDLQFDYTPVMGRNDPVNNITNRIDLWVAGVDPHSAVQAIVFRSSPSFTNAPGNSFFREDFILENGDHPNEGSTFIPLAFGPLITVPPTITIAGNTYGMVTEDHPMDSESDNIRYAYRIVHHNTAFGWAPNSLFGLEWSAAYQPPAGSNFEMEYFFNAVPAIIQRNLEGWRLVSTDVVVHQAIQHNIRVNVAVQFHNPLQADEVIQAIEAELDIFFRDQGIAARIQPSDIITRIANTSGVDAVRWLHGGDYDGWDYEDRDNFDVGLQRITQGNVVKSYVDETGRPLDIPLGDSDIAVFGDVNVSVRAANTFGAS